MARMARAEVFAPDEVAVVHVMNRVVRRCYLLGDDPVSGKNYDHRKVMIGNGKGDILLFCLGTASRPQGGLQAELDCCLLLPFQSSERSSPRDAFPNRRQFRFVFHAVDILRPVRRLGEWSFGNQSRWSTSDCRLQA